MAEEGHVFAPLGYITHQFTNGLEMDPELALAAVEELAQSGAIVAESIDDDRAVYLKALHTAETSLAQRLIDLSRGRPLGPQVIERAMAAAVARAVSARPSGYANSRPPSPARFGRGREAAAFRTGRAPL
jgi:hypothetical protein